MCTVLNFDVFWKCVIQIFSFINCDTLTVCLNKIYWIIHRWCGRALIAVGMSNTILLTKVFKSFGTYVNPMKLIHLLQKRIQLNILNFSSLSLSFQTFPNLLHTHRYLRWMCVYVSRSSMYFQSDYWIWQDKFAYLIQFMVCVFVCVLLSSIRWFPHTFRTSLHCFFSMRFFLSLCRFCILYCLSPFCSLLNATD